MLATTIKVDTNYYWFIPISIASRCF